jgi:hypothetical protein
MNINDLIGKKFIVYDNIIEVLKIEGNDVVYNTWKENDIEGKIQLKTSKSLFQNIYDILVEYKG